MKVATLPRAFSGNRPNALKKSLERATVRRDSLIGGGGRGRTGGVRSRRWPSDRVDHQLTSSATPRLQTLADRLAPAPGPGVPATRPDRLRPPRLPSGPPARSRDPGRGSSPAGGHTTASSTGLEEGAASSSACCHWRCSSGVLAVAASAAACRLPSDPRRWRIHGGELVRSAPAGGGEQHVGQELKEVAQPQPLLPGGLLQLLRVGGCGIEVDVPEAGRRVPAAMALLIEQVQCTQAWGHGQKLAQP